MYPRNAQQKTEDKWIGYYSYISNGAQEINGNPNEKGTWGVAIMVKNSWYQNIENNQALTPRPTNITQYGGKIRRYKSAAHIPHIWNTTKKEEKSTGGK